MLLIIGDAAGTAAMGDDHYPLSLVLVVLTLVGLTSPCARLQGRLHRRAARLPSEHRRALRLRFVDGWASTAWRWRWASTAPPLVVVPWPSEADAADSGDAGVAPGAAGE